MAGVDGRYFVLGVLASGMLLYGISMIYGGTGSLELAGVAESIAAPGPMRLTMVLGLMFVVAGVAFKLGAVPFHVWVPDVYEGAPTPVTMFIATDPKIAAFGMLMRALVDGLGGLVTERSQMLVVLGVLSMAAGNIIAIAQTEHQAHARLLDHRSRRADLRGGDLRHAGRIRRLDVLRPDLFADGAQWLRDGDLARAGRRRGGSSRRLQGTERAQSVVRILWS